MNCKARSTKMQADTLMKIRNVYLIGDLDQKRRDYRPIYEFRDLQLSQPTASIERFEAVLVQSASPFALLYRNDLAAPSSQRR